MKKKFVIFSVYAFVIVATVVIFFLLDPIGLKSDNVLPASQNTKVDSSLSEEFFDVVYAELISINCPTNIKLKPGAKLELMDGFVSIEPANATVTYSLSVSTAKRSGVYSLNNNVFTATENGDYNIVVMAKDSQKSYISARIVIEVTESDDMTTDDLEIEFGSKKSVFETFSNLSEYESFSIYADQKLKIEDDNFIPLDSGVSNVTVVAEKEKVKYTYNFCVNISDKITESTHSIYIDGCVGDDLTINLSQGGHMLYFYIISNNENINAECNISIEDESVVTKNIQTPPYVIFVPNKVGTTKVTFTLTADETVSRTINLIVV